jgi:small subunit ribosomal protein S4e
MNHLKRQAVPKSWPVPRKGTTFVVKPKSDIESGLPILIILRDILKIAKTKKEVKKAINAKNILVNGRVPKEEKNSMNLFDILTIVPSKKNYKLTLKESGKFDIEEISEKDAGKKISKITGKTVLKGRKNQLNLGDGRNILYDKECKTNDSVLIDFKSKKIEKVIPMKEKASVLVFAGKHTGKEGQIEKLKLERQMASVKTDSGKINVLIKQMVVVE